MTSVRIGSLRIMKTPKKRIHGINRIDSSSNQPKSEELRHWSTATDRWACEATNSTVDPRGDTRKAPSRLSARGERRAGRFRFSPRRWEEAPAAGRRCWRWFLATARSRAWDFGFGRLVVPAPGRRCPRAAHVPRPLPDTGDAAAACAAGCPPFAR
ncbi:hypothetical protein SEVIR_5G240350v4 [Setaria viridis]